MKIAFFEIKGWEKDYIKKNLKGHTLIFSPESLSNKNVKKYKNVNIIATFIYSDVSKKIIDQLPQLKLVTTMSTGFDHIDVATCAKKKITACNVPHYGQNTVAEHTFALLLSLSRKIHLAHARTSRNNFSLEGLKGFDLAGKTIGVVGAGNIGQRVIKIANGFEMNVIAFDPNQDQKLAKKLNFKYASLDQLLKQSDIITLHAPLNEHTRHLINKPALKKVKKGAILINTARDGLVETDALIQALDQGILAGAGLDVLELEDFIKEPTKLKDSKSLKALDTIAGDLLLLSQYNTIFTPHLAFFTQEALERIVATTVDNIKGFIKKKPINMV